MPMAQVVSFFVGISIIYPCVAFDEITLLDVDNGNDKSWSSSVSLPLCCLLEDKGFEDEFFRTIILIF
jgi:hypothetical protein